MKEHKVLCFAELIVAGEAGRLNVEELFCEKMMLCCICGKKSYENPFSQALLWWGPHASG